MTAWKRRAEFAVVAGGLAILALPRRETLGRTPRAPTGPMLRGQVGLPFKANRMSAAAQAPE